MIRRAVMALGAAAIACAAYGGPLPVVRPSQSQLNRAESTLPAPQPAPRRASRQTATDQATSDIINELSQAVPPPTNPQPALQTAPASPSPQAAPVVMDARIGEHPDRTRFVIEVSDPVQIRVFTLANPDRVVIDLPDVLWRLQNADRPAGTGAVRSYRYGPFRPGDSRFVIDLNRPVSVAQPMVLPPSDGFGYRVVLDLFETTQAKFDANAGWPADLRAREAAAEKVATARTNAPAQGQSARKVVVIDPGHGGIDTGTTGINGMQEKDLVLDEGLRLGRVLARRGYDVHFTRDSDIFIPLTERVAISRADHADLFISLHADSNPNTQVSGLSIYTLSERGSDAEAAALARKENQSDVIAGVDLSQQDSPVASILIDLAQRDTINRSTRFAMTALGQLSRATDILPREPHRSAAFVVLKAPDVPAVLIELGYLSNPGDAAQMRTDRWRNAVAQAIATAVDRHFVPEPVAGVGPDEQAAK